MEFPFATGVTVAVGEKYWIVLTSSDVRTGYVYAIKDAGTYAGGNGAFNLGSGWKSLPAFDGAFRTFVDVGSGLLDSDASNSTDIYTLVHDPIDTDVTITTVTGSLDVDIYVTPPPNPNADLTGVQIRRGTDAVLSDGVIVKSFYAPATTEVYDYIDTVPATDTYYYGITFRNGDGIETAEYITGQIDVIGDLGVPANFSGVGITTTLIEWTWTDDIDEADGYILEDDTGALIMMLTRPVDTCQETVSGENTPATRHLCSAVFGSTTIEPAIASTGGYVWPWNDAGRHMQMIYLTSELFNQAGNINKIYWKLNSDVPVGGSTFNNVVVMLGHTTNSLLGTNFADNFTESDATEVWNTPTYTVASGTGGDWIEIPITGTFYYNGTNNLILDIDLVSGTTDLTWMENNGAYPLGSSLYAGPGGSSGTQFAMKYLVQFEMDTIESKSQPTTPPEVAYSLVHDATADDFSLALTANPDEVEVTVIPPPNQDAEFTGIKIERADDSGFTVSLTTVQDFTNNYVFIDTSLTPATYWYRITYCNGDGTPSLESTGESIEVPPVSDAPVVVINSPTGGVLSDEVTITYTLTDPQSEPCTINVDYSLDSGANWASCTMGATGDGTSGLTSSTTGTSHTYSWDTVTDGVGAGGMEPVTLRITPFDAAEQGASDTTTFSVSNIINQPPLAQITDPTGGTHSADITITYILSDVDGDTCGTTIEYSPDSGTTWLPCVQGTGGEGTSGLSSTPEGDTHTFVFDSSTIGTTGDVSVQLMITPSDKDGEGTPDTVTFTVNNVPQEPPAAAITDPTAGTYFGDVTITYTLTDTNSDTCTITAEYTIVGSGTWNPCAEGTGGDGLTGLDSSPAGVTHTFVWDTVANNVGTVAPEDVQVRITPDDGAAGTADTSGQFTVDNTGPGPLDADFTADTTTGPASLTVNFTDISTGNYDLWHWDFGDGTTSTEQNPTHIYYLVGTYTVTLTIDGPDGNDSETKTDYITVTDPGSVTANFTGTPTNGTAPLDVQFTDLSAGNITSWEWDFDFTGFATIDSTDRNPGHQYTNAGTYTVRLTVSGPSGNDTLTRTDYIVVTDVPGAGKKKSGGCSCTVDADPTPASHLLGYFMPVLLLACAYLALRRCTEAA
jgi:PKD repeat protein